MVGCDGIAGSSKMSSLGMSARFAFALPINDVVIGRDHSRVLQ